jgi:hypothetical protein
MRMRALLWQVIVICGAKHSSESNFLFERLPGCGQILR